LSYQQIFEENQRLAPYRFCARWPEGQGVEKMLIPASVARFCLRS
jgi:hypothetical protein